MMFALLGSLAIGLIVRYSMKNRDRVGLVMIPAIATASGALVWAIGTWCTLSSKEPWLWLATFVVAAIVPWIVNYRLIRLRIREDAAAMGRIARHS